MGSVKCYMIEPIDMQHAYLRRYHSSSDLNTSCPAHGYHNAKHYITDLPVRWGHAEDGRRYVESDDHLKPPKFDSRWPRLCDCGYHFTDDDPFQLFTVQLYRRLDTGQVMTVEEAPGGAIWNAWWIADGKQDKYRGPGSMVGPDGMSLMCKLPNGSDWFIDGPANNGPGWSRTGVPPMLSVTPSILVHANETSKRVGYHGFLTNGELREC